MGARSTNLIPGSNPKPPQGDTIMMLGSFAYDSRLVLGSVYYPNGKRVCTTHKRTGPTIYQTSRDTQRFNYDVPAARQRYPGIAERGNELSRAARDLCECLL